MEFEHRGAGRQGQPESSQAKGPEQKQTLPGTPRAGERGERKPLPSVWEVLEHGVRLDAPNIEDRPRRGSEAYKREVKELDRLYRELDKRGTPRAKLIRDLYYEIRYEPAPFPSPVRVRKLSLEEFQQFRSKVEPMTEEQIAEELRKAEEENDRKSDEFFKNNGGGYPPKNSIVRV